MPRPPGLIDKVNFIIDFIQDPCEAPWQVYVETALPALGDLILVWFDFGLDDVIRGYFRPAGLRSFGHWRGRKRLPKNRRKPSLVRSLKELLEDDLGNIIGKHLPGANIVKARKVSSLERTLWIIDTQIQRVLFYWMVIDVTTDFFYSWTSTLIKTEYCQNQYNYALYGEADQYALTPGGQAAISGLFTEKKRRGNLSYRADLQAWHLPGPGVIVASAEQVRTQTFPGHGHLEIRRLDDPEPLDQSTRSEGYPEGVSQLTKARVGEGWYQVWAVNDSQDYCLWQNLTLSIMGAGAQ